MKRLPWTSADLELLRREFAEKPTAAIAATLGRTPSATAQKAVKLGLTKSAAYLASSTACRLHSASDAGKAHRFKPGHKTWNAGVRGSTGTHAACRAHQFQKGRPAEEQWKFLPIGTTRLGKSGELLKKVSNDPQRSRRWVAVSRLVWVEAYGPIQDGYAVVFKPGRQSIVEADIVADALECIPRAELMRRNSAQRYGPEIAGLIQLRGVISRHINKRAKESATP